MSLTTSALRSTSPWLARSVLLGGVLLGACSNDAPQGNVAALSVSGGGVGGSDGGSTAGTAGAAGSNEGGASSSAGQAGSGPVVSAGTGGGGGAGQAGSGTGGAGAGGGGDAFPVGGPLYHVTCRTSLAGGDPKSAFRFAGKILALAGGQRFVYLQPLATNATTLAQTVGAVQKGQSEGAAVDGDPVFFGNVTIPPAANPITSNVVVVADASLRLVIAGPGSRPCAELEGTVTKPVEHDLTAPNSIDTCLFDPVVSADSPVVPVTDEAAFVSCVP